MTSQFPPFPPRQQPEPEQPKRKRSVGKMLAIGIGVVLLLIIVVSVASGGGSSNTSSSAPATTQPPVTYALPAPAAPVAPTPVTADKPAGPATTASDGVYEVGVDLAPGRYKTAGPDASDFMPNCYYARLKDDSGDFKSIIANDNLQGPGSVTVKAGEFVKFSGDCTWTKA
jgi:hypothetical protein